MVLVITRRLKKPVVRRVLARVAYALLIVARVISQIVTAIAVLNPGWLMDGAIMELFQAVAFISTLIVMNSIMMKAIAINTLFRVRELKTTLAVY